MLVEFGELHNKEMICVKDGFKIGYVDDVEFDVESYKIANFICYGRTRLFGLLGRTNDIKISYEQIKVIGEDIILVDGYERNIPKKVAKPNFWERLFE